MRIYKFSTFITKIVPLNGSEQMNTNTIKLRNDIANEYENHNFVP